MSPQVTGTDARLTVTWAYDVHIEPGSVPDRPMKYSRNSAVYRPDKLSLSLQAIATGSLLRPLNLTTARVSDRARRTITVTGLTISGPRLGKDGSTPTKNRHDEHLYLSGEEVPDWARELAAQALADLTADRP